MRTAFWLTCVILAVELAGGWLSGSLALWSDASHVLTDLGAIGLSWYALRMAQRPPTARMTFGYQRTGILAALANAATLVLLAAGITSEAIRRLAHPAPVHGWALFAAAGVGLALNLYMGLTLHRAKDLNISSAALHMLSDAAASAAVLVSGAAMAVTRWYALDPLLSIAIALLTAASAVGIARRAGRILLEAVPPGIDVATIADVIRAVPGVVGVHDLHIWSLNAGQHALSCHVVLEGNPTLDHTQDIVRAIEQALRNEQISHVTIQPEDIHHLHDESLLCAVPGTQQPPR
ncbi:MAG: cation transporter [Alicyclobacillaceae bacterium]|nr:cation transporter [Alicyclobacillaceae bacterium]